MSLSFHCPHCRAESQVAEALAGCVINCTACGRGVVVPMTLRGTPADLPARGSGGLVRRMLLTLLFGFGAASLLGLVSFFVAAVIERNTIGMDMFDVLVISLIGLACGGGMGSIVGWRLGAKPVDSRAHSS